jgi:hypothetical protein
MLTKLPGCSQLSADMRVVGGGPAHLVGLVTRGFSKAPGSPALRQPAKRVPPSTIVVFAPKAQSLACTSTSWGFLGAGADTRVIA